MIEIHVMRNTGTENVWRKEIDLRATFPLDTFIDIFKALYEDTTISAIQVRKDT